MNHMQMQLLVSAYQDGETNESENAMVLAHLESCPECREFIEHARVIREEIRSLAEVELSPAFVHRVARSVESQDEQSLEWNGVEPLARNVFFAIAVLVLLLSFAANYTRSASAGLPEPLMGVSPTDSATTHVLLQQGDLSNNDLLYAMLVK